MKVKVFTIRLIPEKTLLDQELLNDFLESIEFIKSDTHFVEEETGYWSVLVHYNDKKEDIQSLPMHESDLTVKQLEIYNNLKSWRAQKADRLKVSSFVICYNSELLNIAIKKPRTTSELKTIKGFGDLKSQKHGEEIITILNAI